MKIAVAIPNHNQKESVSESIRRLYSGSTKPSAVYVMSDDKPYVNTLSDLGRVITINNKDKFKGRCENRNSVIKEFLDSDFDALVFMDGDCCPYSNNFIGTYTKLLKKYDLIFGSRIHSDITGLSKPPSDLLTANMDNLYTQSDLDYRDLRVVSGAFTAWNKSTSFSEKLDLLLTGMISWSCNFGITRQGLLKLLKFEKKNFNNSGVFDNNCFKDKWGYEDVAMGIDALYAGLNIGVTDNVRVLHKSHDRSDGLFDHVKGRHLIMERYRAIEKNKNIKNSIYWAMIIATLFYTAGLITGLFTEYISLLKILGFML